MSSSSSPGCMATSVDSSSKATTGWLFARRPGWMSSSCRTTTRARRGVQAAQDGAGRAARAALSDPPAAGEIGTRCCRRGGRRAGGFEEELTDLWTLSRLHALGRGQAHGLDTRGLRATTPRNTRRRCSGTTRRSALPGRRRGRRFHPQRMRVGMGFGRLRFLRRVPGGAPAMRVRSMNR